ncbi:hypothetical protein [Pedobacter aquatilis]|uniref:hypothetical protein n=1 Tax=Pedobacter aquatilis TaxID=351343 RepID=UPI00292FB618|nr:hypothetical protein [Pedobacter aquatilis]
MKIKVLLTSLLLLFCVMNSFGADGCLIAGRVYINPPPACSNCPANSEGWSGGTNYIVFSNAATECNSNPYKSSQYIKVGEITNRNTSFGNNSCYTTSGGSGFTSGTAVSYPRFYNCPIDDYILMLVIPIVALCFYEMRKYNLISALS